LNPRRRPLRLPIREIRGLAASRPAAELLVPALAGFFWLAGRVSGYPPGYLFVPSADILVVQLGTWLLLLSESVAVAAALWLAVRFLACDGVAAKPPDAARAVVLLAGTVTLGLALRVVYLDLIPPGFWVDGVQALRAASGNGRFFWPHEGRALLPGSRVVVFGLYLDFVRALLLGTGDRIAAYHLVNLVPAALIPAAVYALARRLTDGRAAVFAAFVSAVSFWALVLARWGWDQQLMTVLVLLALERLAAGMPDARPGALVVGGALAGLACHTFIGGFLGAAGLVAWCAFEAYRTRTSRRVLLPGIGLFLTTAPIAVFYLQHPELLGGRVSEAHLRGSPIAILRTAAMNLVDYVGEFFFTPDPNGRHGLLEPQLTPLLVLFLVVGLVAVLGSARRVEAGWRGFASLVFATLSGGILSTANAAPSTYRTGLAGALACVPIGAGLACAVGARFFSPAARAALCLLLPTLVLVTESSRLLRWGLPETGGTAFPLQASIVGRFLHAAGAARVLVDPAVLLEGASSPNVAMFQVSPADVTAPIPPPPLGTLAEAARRNDLDWFVTFSPIAGKRTLHLGLPGEPGVLAVRVR
jgi:hypothetical protein